MQEQGRKAVSPKYGPYEYDAILGGLGEVLSIFEASDELEQNCAPQFARAGSVGRHAELGLDTGLHHGFLYRAMPEWIGPVVRWAREHDA